MLLHTVFIDERTADLHADVNNLIGIVRIKREMTNASVTKTSLENATDSSMIVVTKAEGVTWCTVLILASVFIVVGNCLTIVLFARNKTLRKKSLFLVINMAFVDLMLGALALPVYVYYLGAYCQLWKEIVIIPLDYFFLIVDTVPIVATLNSAASISAERFYAVYWPFKHRTLSMRAYCIAICTVWTLALLVSAVWVTFNYFTFISYNHAVYVWAPYTFILTLFICACNIGIWRKFQHGSVAFQQENRASQNKRLTKTLLFVSVLALLSWLPLIIGHTLDALYVSIPWRYRIIASILNYSNSFVNPIVYALRIPEFKQALSLCCLRREAPMNGDGAKRGNNTVAKGTRATQLRTLRADPTHLQLAFYQEVTDTKL